MPISTAYLDGDMEPFAETIRYWLAKNWPQDAPVAPIFLSPQGQNDKKAGDPIGDANLNAARAMNAVITDGDGKNKPQNGGDGIITHRYISYVEIAAYAPTIGELEQIENIIDEIILLQFPDNTRRINKSDGKTSAIAILDQDSLDWSPPTGNKEANINYMSTAQLGCVWQQSNE